MKRFSGMKSIRERIKTMNVLGGFGLSFKSIIGLSALILLVPMAALSAALADDDDHIYCVTGESIAKDSNERRKFYSAVFLGDYLSSYKYNSPFQDFLERKYGDLLFDLTFCFFENTPRAASRRLAREAAADRQSDLYGGDVIMTGWAPDNFSNQSIQDFRIQIAGGSGKLEVCVRDHECEDGDKIRVTVGGRTIFSGEIDNDWVCDMFNVESGRRYSVELFAINGTGRKGNCNFADVNTGELRVSGDNTETQSWRHRGGAGSRAQIIVKTR